jgi:hypothetical protein
MIRPSINAVAETYALGQEQPELGTARARSQCRFKCRGTESIRKSGMKWVNGRATRQCDRTLGTALSPISGVRCNRFIHVATRAADLRGQGAEQPPCEPLAISLPLEVTLEVTYRRPPWLTGSDHPR